MMGNYRVRCGVGENVEIISKHYLSLYKGNQLSDLSRSETIATALEFANMFNKISKANFPIYIDDYESCADYNFVEEYGKDTQLIISKVKKGSALKIADYNSNKSAQKISTDTSEFNSNKHIGMNNAAKLPQVA